MHKIVDLRSDTVTRPTPEMRRAMAEAEVGDDVLGDDPTVNRLEELAASMLGNEAALFVPTGTMGNAIAIKVHTQPGDEVLLDWDSHSICYEVGGPAALAGVLTRPFRSMRGVPDLDEIVDSIHEPDLHAPGTTLIMLENSHNRSGGCVIPFAFHRDLHQMASEGGLKVHIDGARIFNAAVASGIPAAEFAAQADSITFCLSKGLGCPVGSLLCGSHTFIEKARRIRKMLGGGMRQAGVLASCGIVALNTMIDRLAEDHTNARRLAKGIHGLPGISFDPDAVQTNMIYFSTAGPAQELVDHLAEEGVRCLTMGPRTIRLVTHHDVDTADIENAVTAISNVARILYD